LKNFALLLAEVSWAEAKWVAVLPMMDIDETSDIKED
jgi:hypothetical protein